MNSLEKQYIKNGLLALACTAGTISFIGFIFLMLKYLHPVISGSIILFLLFFVLVSLVIE